MDVYILEWYYTEPYEQSNGVLGCYSSVSKAEDAYNVWYAEQPEQSEYCCMGITHRIIDEEISNE